MTIPGVYAVLGAALGFANAGRHRFRGYRTPRPADAAPDNQYAVAVVDAWEQHGAAWENKRVLELGPGASLTTGRLVLSRGAAGYLAVDCVPLVSNPELPYVVTEYPVMRNVSGVFDVIVSHAALEHFHDVAATFRRLSELAAPGCVMVHHVDAKTHMRWVRDRDPLNLLRYPDWLYRMMSFPGVPNRLRASEYVAAAEAAGFAADYVPVEGLHARGSSRAVLRSPRSPRLADLAIQQLPSGTCRRCMRANPPPRRRVRDARSR